MQLKARKENADYYLTGQSVDNKPVIQARISNGRNSIDRTTGQLEPTSTLVINETNGTSTKAVERGRGLFNFGDNSGNSKKHLCEVRCRSGKGIGLKHDADGHDIQSSNGNKVIFSGDAAYHIESESLYKGVRNKIVITDPSTAPLIYDFTVKIKGGANYAVLEAGNSITFVDLDGDDDIYIGQAYAVDSSGEYGPCGIDYMGYSNGLHTIRKWIDETWLRSRVGEVILDPTVTIKDGVDGGIIEDARLKQNLNYGANIFLSHYNSDTTRVESFLIRPDMSAYTGTIAVSAKWRLYCGLVEPNNNYNVGVHHLLRQWGEGTGNGSAPNLGECTAAYAKFNTVAWTGNGASGAGDRVATPSMTYNGTTITQGAYNEFVLDITQFQTYEIDGSNYGVVFVDQDLVSTFDPLSQIVYYSTDFGSTPPELVYEYLESDGANNRNLLLLLKRAKDMKRRNR